MQPVAQHADQKEQDAVRLFVEAQRILEAAEQQLQQIFSYREEYSQQLLAADSDDLSAQRLRDHQSFVARIGQTIEQLHIDIENKKQICEMQKQAWLKCRGRSYALNSVVEKYKLEEFKEQERFEQKEQDEHAQRIGSKTGKKQG
jgi:flagellar protein FliJ